MPRGITTAHNRPSSAPNQPPEISNLVRRDAPVNVDEVTLYRFVNTSSRNFIWKIVKFSDDDEEMQALVDQAVHDLNDQYVRFHDWAFVTASPAVARLLILRARESGRFEIFRDQESLVFQCPNCEARFGNTADGREQFSLHMLDNHLDLTVPVVTGPLEPARPLKPEEAAA